jgi:hypothetical protein
VVEEEIIEESALQDVSTLYYNSYSSAMQKYDSIHSTAD